MLVSQSSKACLRYFFRPVRCGAVHFCLVLNFKGGGGERESWHQRQKNPFQKNQKKREGNCITRHHSLFWAQLFCTAPAKDTKKLHFSSIPRRNENDNTSSWRSEFFLKTMLLQFPTKQKKESAAQNSNSNPGWMRSPPFHTLSRVSLRFNTMGNPSE